MIRMTRQRRLILEELRKLETHPTADELYVMLRKKMPRISLGTVYRNLEILSEEGVINKLDSAGNRMRFDASLHQHTHIRCICCGRIDDLPADVSIPDLDAAVCRKTGYKAVSYRLEYLGLCPACKKSKGSR